MKNWKRGKSIGSLNAFTLDPETVVLGVGANGEEHIGTIATLWNDTDIFSEVGWEIYGITMWEPRGMGAVWPGEVSEP